MMLYRPSPPSAVDALVTVANRGNGIECSLKLRPDLAVDLVVSQIKSPRCVSVGNQIRKRVHAVHKADAVATP